MIYSVQEILDIYDLKNASWSGAVDTIQFLIDLDNYDLQREFVNYLNDYIQENYNGNIDQTELNDLLWFEDQFMIDFYQLNYEDQLINKKQYNKIKEYYGI